MSYYFSTRSGTVYTVQDTENPNVQLITGGHYDKNAIWRPQNMIGEGQRFQAEFVADQKNQQMGIAGRTLNTSPIVSIHAFQSSHSARVAQAESICPTSMGYDNGPSYEY